MPTNDKPVYMKTRAHCADGTIRSVYSQLTPRMLDTAEIEGHYPGHIKLELVSVSGRVFPTETKHLDAEGDTFCSNFFEPLPEGRNAHLMPSWYDIADLFNKTTEAS